MTFTQTGRSLANGLIATFVFTISGSLFGQARNIVDVPRPSRISLSNTPGQSSSLSDLAVWDKRAYLVWREETEQFRSQQIRLRVSADGGLNFGDGPSGRILGVVPAHETVFSIRVAARDSDVYIVATSGVSPSLARISLFRSVDHGATFSRVALEALVEGGTPYPDVAVDAQGRLHLVVEDRGETEDIYYVHSADRGDSFSEPLNISHSANHSIAPRISTSEKHIAIVWQDTLGADQRTPGTGIVRLIHSSDGGETFSSVSDLSEVERDSSSPSVAYGNSLHVVWSEEGRVVYRQSGDGGRSFSVAAEVAAATERSRISSPRVAALERSVRVAWMLEDVTGTLHGPFVRLSRGGDFGSTQDLSATYDGGAFGAPAISAGADALVVWPHTNSGFAADAEIVATSHVVCTVSWLNPVDGQWNEPAKWSTGVLPGINDDVCISVDGTYTVTNPNPTRFIRSLTVGHPGNLGVQTLVIQPIGSNGSSVITTTNDLTNYSRITMDGAISSAAAEIGSTNGVFTNTTTGILTVLNTPLGARSINANTVNQGNIVLDRSMNLLKQGGSFTNEGTFTLGAAGVLGCSSLSCTVNQNSGTIGGSGMVSINQDTFNFNGGDITATAMLTNSALHLGADAIGEAHFVFRSGSNTITGDTHEGQTFLVEGIGPNGAATLTAQNTFTNRGTFILDATNASASSSSTGGHLVIATGTMTNAPSGLIHSRATVRGNSTRSIQGDVVNQGTVQIDRMTSDGILTISNESTVLGKTNSVFLNEGSFIVEPLASVIFGVAVTFTQASGTLKIPASALFTTNDDFFNFNGGNIIQDDAGSIPGQVRLTGASDLRIGPASSGIGTFIFNSSNNTLAGDVAPGQTIVLSGIGPNGGAGVNITTDVHNRGSIVLDTEGAASNNSNTGASLVVTGATLTNEPDGLIHAANTIPGGSYRDFFGDIINFGTVRIDRNIAFRADNATFTNEGTVDIATGATASFPGGTMVFNQNGGELDVDGVFTMNGDTFNFNGGTVDGFAHLTVGSRLNIGSESNSPGGFVFQNGGNTITGNIAAGQTVLLHGLGPNAHATVTAPEGFTNAGTIILDAFGLFAESSNTGATFVVTNGTFVNAPSGLIHSRVSLAGSSLRIFNFNLTNFGTVDIDKNTSLNKLGATYTNRGAWDIAPLVNATLSGAVGNVTSFLQEAPGAITGGGTLTLGLNTIFKGVGSMTGNLSIAGQFHPGASPGVLNITGNYTQTGNGTFFAEIGGATPGLFDQLNVTGTATLAGTLNASLFGGHCPEGSYAILNYGARSGNFTLFSLNAGPGRTFTTTAGATSYLLNTNGPRCNTAPVAFDDAYDAVAGAPLTVAAPGVLANDTDAENDPITAVLVTPPLHGTLTLNPDGGFVYTPPAIYVSSDSFSYKVRDVPPSPSTPLESNTATVTVTIIDAIAPTTTAQSTPAPNANGWNDGDVEVALHAVDNDGGSGVKEIHYQINGDPEQIVIGADATFVLTAEGVHTIQFFAVDHAGNQESAKTLIVRIDRTAPTVDAPADVARATASDATECGTLISDDDLGVATTSDNLSTVSVTRTGVPAGNLFPVGTTTITYTGTDQAGNTATDSQTVTVTDATDPVVTAPDDLSRSTGADATSCSVVISDEELGSATATDNCPGVVMTRTGVPAGNVFTAGTHLITYTATDAAGNTSEDTQQITVTDSTDPAVTAPADVSRATSADATSCSVFISDADLGVAITSDNCSTVTVTRTGVPAGNVFPLGTTTITYTAVDESGNQSTDTQVISVTDGTAPQIQAPSAVSKNTGPSSNSCSLFISDEELGAATGSDNCGNVTVTRSAVPEGNLFPIGTTTITYTATDEAGNTSTGTQTVTVADETDPVITAPAGFSRSTGADAASCGVVIPDTELGSATASDNCTDVVVTRTGVPAGNVFTAGTHVITYTATDASGNTSQDTQQITITDNTNPAITAPADLSRAAGATSCTVFISDADLGIATTSDNCSLVTVTRSGVPAGNVFPVGTTIITYTARDESGNESTDTQLITVTDGTAPSIETPADITRNTGPDSTSCSLFISDAELGTATATDNCGNATITRTGVPAGNMFAVGTTVITYTATDDAGNPGTATQSVTVVDDTAPVVTAPADVTRTTGSGATSCGVFIPDSVLDGATFTENCIGSTVTRTGVPAGNIFPVGTTTVTYTVTDLAGNVGSDTQLVTVTDDTVPVMACPSDTVVDAAAGSCAANVNPTAPAASDNCSVSVAGTRSDGLALNAPYPVGTTTILWVAMDPSGNQTSCPQKVTVRDTQAPSISNAAASPSILQPPDGRMVDVAISYNLGDNCGAASAVLSISSSDPDTGDPDFVVVNANLVRLRAEVAAGATERRYTITITATDANGNTSSASVLVRVPAVQTNTPLSILEKVERDLDRKINENRGKKGVNHLEKALRDVRKAIAALGQQPPNRACAVNVIKNAVQAIEVAKGKVLTVAEGNALQKDLTDVSRMLVEEAIAAAIASGANQKKIQHAQQMLADGNAAAASGDYRRAAQEYKTAISVLEGGGCGNAEDDA